jgi:hypothetical protein
VQRAPRVLQHATRWVGFGFVLMLASVWQARQLRMHTATVKRWQSQCYKLPVVCGRKMQRYVPDSKCFVCQTLMLCSHSITEDIRGSLTKPESELLEYFVWALYCCVGTLIDANTRTPARGNGRKSSFRHGAHSAKGTAQQGERSRSGALSACLRANAYAV